MSSTEVLSWLISGIVVVLLGAFAAYVIGLRALPVDRRPLTPIYDRLGQRIGEAENPDYHENPGEYQPDDTVQP